MECVVYFQRVALGMGQDSVEALREVGKLLAFLKEPDPPKGLKDAWDKLPIFKQVLSMGPKSVKRADQESLHIHQDGNKVSNEIFEIPPFTVHRHLSHPHFWSENQHVHFVMDLPASIV